MNQIRGNQIYQIWRIYFSARDSANFDFFQIKFAQCGDCIQLFYPKGLNVNLNKSNSKCNVPWDRKMQPQSWE
jgi:hypothetical protein